MRHFGRRNLQPKKLARGIFYFCFVSGLKILAAVELTMNIAEAFVRDVRVNLRGDDIFVSQKFLNRTEIHALRQ